MYVANLSLYKKEKKMTTKEGTKIFRTTARVVGAFYLAGFVVGIGGEMLIQSNLSGPDPLSAVAANSMMVALGAILWLVAVFGDAAHGVLMYPVLKPHGERLAIGYLASRILDAAFIAIMVLFLLIQIPLSSEYVRAAAADASYLQILSNVSVDASQYAYAIGMSTLGVSGLMLCFVLYRAKLVPRILAIWGLLGYAIIFVGMLSQIMGSGLGLMSSLPGGLWEVFIGGWLIVKGFNPSAFEPKAVRTSSPAGQLVPVPVTAKSSSE